MSAQTLSLRPLHLHLQWALLLGCLSLGGCHCGSQTLALDCPSPPLGQTKGTPPTSFSKDAPLYGCVGLSWQGTQAPPKGYVGRLYPDGHYELRDPKTGTFVTSLQATLEGSATAFAWRFFVMKVNAAAAESLDCVGYLRNGVQSCWLDPNCLWFYESKVTKDSTPGTCQLCRREECNGKDDDCDGQTDEDGACGELFTDTPCRLVPKPPQGPCDSTKACECQLTQGPQPQVYLCAGAKAETQRWTRLDDVTSRCQSQTDIGKTGSYHCGTKSLLCDVCPEKKTGWRSIQEGCAGGTLRHSFRHSQP